MITELVFELGQVLLKTQLSKAETPEELKSRGGAVDERVVHQQIGKFWNQRNWFDRPDGLIVVTNYRLAFLSKLETITTTTSFLSFPYANIENLRTDRVWWVSPAIRFETEGEPYVFTLFSGADALKSAIDEARA